MANKNLYLKIRNSIINLLLIFFGIFVALILLELFIRTPWVSRRIKLDVDSLKNQAVFSSSYWNLPRPYTATVFAPFPGIRALDTTNRLGFRDGDYSFAKPDNTFRIIVLGDSMTFGAGVESYESYPKVLETLLNKRGGTIDGVNFAYQVLNMGVKGHGPLAYKGIFEEIGQKYNPDLVIIGFHYLTDPFDAYSQDLNKVAFKLQAIPDEFLSPNLNAFLKEKSRLWDWFLAFYYSRIEKLKIDPIKNIFGDSLSTRGVYEMRIEPNEKIFYGWQLSEESFNAIRQRTKDKNTELLMVGVPAREEIVVEAWKELRKSGAVVDERVYTNSAPRNIFNMSCQKNLWNCLDLTNKLRDHKSPAKLFIENDFHFSAEGHKKVAEALFRYIIDNKLVPYNEMKPK